jgi:hypothetical protein
MAARKHLKQKMPAGRAAKEDVISANAGLKSHLWAVFSFKDVESVDTAAIWARRILPAKNSLNIADARQLENAFEERLAALKRCAAIALWIDAQARNDT